MAAKAEPRKTVRNDRVYFDVVDRNGPRMSYSQAALRHNVSKTRIQQIVAREKTLRGEQ